MYERVLPNGLVIRSTAPEHATQLEELQKTVFPTLHDTQRLKKAHYLKHIQIFAAGQFVALDQNKVIGMTTTIRLAEDFLNGAHRFDEVIQGGFCTSHDPQGDWLYGVDMGTHPDYRGRGVARALYLARAATVTALKLKGQYTMGMLSGYGPLRATIPINQYYQQLLRGEIADPTVSAQIKLGFEPHGVVEDYLDDPVCAGCCVRLVLPASKIIGDEPRYYK